MISSGAAKFVFWSSRVAAAVVFRHSNSAGKILLRPAFGGLKNLAYIYIYNTCYILSKSIYSYIQVDPSADWKKWTDRRPDFQLYYAALVDPARDSSDGIMCVLRAVMDGIPTPTPPHRPRLVIDYVTTRVAARGRGLAYPLPVR